MTDDEFARLIVDIERVATRFAEIDAGRTTRRSSS